MDQVNIGAPNTMHPYPTPYYYFAYGSNLSIERMRSRYPEAQYVGVGHLWGYEWFINSQRKANIAPMRPYPATGHPFYQPLYGVWGLIYRLTPGDKSRLIDDGQRSHGRPPMEFEVEFWPSYTSHPFSQQSLGPCPGLLTRSRGMFTPVLAHVDTEYHERGPCIDTKYYERERHRNNEDLEWIDKGITDAWSAGIPMMYLLRILRPDIPWRNTEASKNPRRIIQFQAEKAYAKVLLDEQRRAERQRHLAWVDGWARQEEDSLRIRQLVKQSAKNLGIYTDDSGTIGQHESGCSWQDNLGGSGGPVGGPVGGSPSYESYTGASHSPDVGKRRRVTRKNSQSDVQEHRRPSSNRKRSRRTSHLEGRVSPNSVSYYSRGPHGSWETPGKWHGYLA